MHVNATFLQPTRHQDAGYLMDAQVNHGGNVREGWSFRSHTNLVRSQILVHAMVQSTDILQARVFRGSSMEINQAFICTFGPLPPISVEIPFRNLQNYPYFVCLS